MFSAQAKFFKRLLPKTLLGRFALIIIVPSIVGQFLAVELFYYRHWYNVASYSSRTISREIKNLVEVADNMPQEMTEYLSLEYQLIEEQELPSFPTPLIEELKIFKAELSKAISLPFSVHIINNDRTIELFLQHPDDPNMIFRILVPAKALINPSAFVFVLWMSGLGALLLLVTLIFTKNQLKSILILTKAAETYGRGGKIDGFKPVGAKEIRRAGLAFLKMKDRIERQTARRTQVLAMISHDLKTPLTRMKLQVELMEDSEEKEELQFDIDSMQHMIAAYLDFSKGEGGEKLVTVKISEWLSEYASSHWQERVWVSIPELEDEVEIKPHAFSRALSNLVENALKYSTNAKISLYSKGSEEEFISIHVEDDGPGISSEDKKNVFKPFFRGDKSRTLHSSSSVGLGLAITREIISGHYGTIDLKDSKELGGLLVEIKLPKKEIN